MNHPSLIRELLGTTCPACNGTKKTRQTLCGRCYHALPKNMQMALYRYVGAGYEEAYEAAVKFLRNRSAA